MDRTTPPAPRRALAAAAAAALAACAGETPLGPHARGATTPQLERAGAGAAARAARAVDLGACAKLAAPEGSRLAYRAYAVGVQIYRWSGTEWVFVAPEAVLYAAPGSRGAVGTHYAGPTWRSVSGSTVVGALLDRCPVGGGAIPWLSLRAVSAHGPGVLARTTFIQRLDTEGGTAPPSPGAYAGEEARVPYTADYYFYRAG